MEKISRPYGDQEVSFQYDTRKVPSVNWFIFEDAHTAVAQSYLGCNTTSCRRWRLPMWLFSTQLRWSPDYSAIAYCLFVRQHNTPPHWSFCLRMPDAFHPIILDIDCPPISLFLLSSSLRYVKAEAGPLLSAPQAMRWSPLDNAVWQLRNSVHTRFYLHFLHRTNSFLPKCKVQQSVNFRKARYTHASPTRWKLRASGANVNLFNCL